MEQCQSARDVGRALLRHPIRHFVGGWNWKSAVVSSLFRGGLFFCVNLPSGVDAGTRAFAIELGFRAIASGILGSATQAFRNVTPGVHGIIAVLLVIPAVGHSAEYTVHRLAHTARLDASITASLAFTMVSTAFNLFAMRRGALIVGARRQSLLHDLRRMPQLVVAFVLTVVTTVRASVIRQPRDNDPCQYRRST